MQNLKNFVKLDRELKDLVFFYKCRNGFTDLNVYDFVSPVSHGRTRLSNSYNLKTPVCKTSTFQASYFNRIVKLWNYICKFSPPTSFSTTASFLPSWLFNLLYVTFVMVNKAVKKKRKKKKKADKIARVWLAENKSNFNATRVQITNNARAAKISSVLTNCVGLDELWCVYSCKLSTSVKKDKKKDKKIARACSKIYSCLLTPKLSYYLC